MTRKKNAEGDYEVSECRFQPTIMQLRTLCMWPPSCIYQAPAPDRAYENSQNQSYISRFNLPLPFSYGRQRQII